ncbi:MAG: hypothetical protein ABSG91_21995, partial [Syntrophobacteraceae bacterium]
KAFLLVNFERFTRGRLSYIPGIVKLWESPGRAGGLPVINYMYESALYLCVLIGISYDLWTLGIPRAFSDKIPPIPFGVHGESSRYIIQGGNMQINQEKRQWK